MEITINQQIHSVPENCSVEYLLNSILPHPSKGLAVAINQQIVPKPEWPVYRLKPEDKVMLIKATQGG